MRVLLDMGATLATDLKHAPATANEDAQLAAGEAALGSALMLVSEDRTAVSHVATKANGSCGQ